MNRKRLVKGSLVVSLVLALVASGGVVMKKQAAAHSEEGQIVTVQRGKVSIAVQEVGSVEAFRKIDLKSKVSGQVAEVLVDIGSRVKAGDVLVRLDPRDARRELAQAEARRAVNNAVLNQGTMLLDIQAKAHEQGGIPAIDVRRSEGDVKKFRAQLGVDEADTAILRDRVSYTELRSPLDGVVLARNVQPGEMVTPGVSAMVDGKPLLVVAQVEKLLVRAELNQVDVVRLHMNQDVTVRVDALPDQKFVGNVYRIAAMAQKSERRRDSNLMIFPVDVVVDATQNGAEALRPGMVSDISVDLGAHENVLKVPLEAIVRDGDKTQLRVLSEKKEEKDKETLTDVVIGYQNEHEAEILSGVAEGVRIRVRPSSAPK